MSVRFVWYKAAANPSFFSTIMLTAGYSRPLAVSLSLQASSIFIVLPFLHKIPSQKNRNTQTFHGYFGRQESELYLLPSYSTHS